MSSKMSRCNLKLLALSMAGVAALGLAAPTASASVSGAIVGDLHDIPDCTPVVALVVPGALNSLAAIPESIPHGLQTRKVTAKLEQRGWRRGRFLTTQLHGSCSHTSALKERAITVVCRSLSRQHGSAPTPTLLLQVTLRALISRAG